MIAIIDIGSIDSVAVVEITLWKLSEPKSNLDNKPHFEFHEFIFIPRKWTIQSKKFNYFLVTPKFREVKLKMRQFCFLIEANGS